MKKLTALFLFWLSFFYAKADTFLVTSNADSGPGTLREAIILANANGTTNPDIINFGLAGTSRSDRTITILTDLPALSSNLVIDGSTQNGLPFGNSDAKVILYSYSTTSLNLTFFKIANASNIEIYGLFLLNGYFSLFSYGNYTINGIDIANSQNLVFGKAGKGNYFRGLKQAIFSSNNLIGTLNCSNILIQGNVFGNDESGEPTLNHLANTLVNPVEYGIRLFNCSNILIGGYSSGEENIITAQEVIFQSYLTSGNGYLRLIRNNFGIRTDGTLPSPGNTARVKVSVLGDYLGNSTAVADYDLLIKNNFISNHLSLRGLTKPFVIQGNKLIYDNNNHFGYHEPKMNIYACSGGGIIGGDKDSLKNEFFDLRCEPGPFEYQSLTQGSIIVSVSPKVMIQQNKMMRNHQYGSSILVYSTLPFRTPYVRIDSMVANFVKGKATPGSRIEVFLDDQCKACDGEVYLGETQSANDSTWSFSGVFTGTVIATVTKDSTTSGYTEPVAIAQNYSVKHPTCGENNGEIKGLIATGSWTGTEWHRRYWENNMLKDSIVTTNADLTNASPGDYYFIAKLGNTCQSAAILFKLKNYSPKIDSSALVVKQPSCGLSNGAITGVKVIDAEFSKIKWMNEQGAMFPGTQSGQNVFLANVPPGRYKLIVTDTTSGCADSTEFYTLVNQSGPSLVTSAVQITAAVCMSNTGSITGITTANVTGTPAIRWVDSLNNVVGTTFDLVNVPPGKYCLKFKDGSGCDTIITPFYIVPNNGDIRIDTALKIILPAKCTGNTGSIRNIIVTGGTIYEWRNTATNTIVGNTLDISNLPAGNYQLTVRNNFGCAKSSAVFTVPQASFIPIGISFFKTYLAFCGLPNGSVRPETFTADTSLYTFRWIDSTTNQAIGSYTQLYGIFGGTYQLFARDSNGCERMILKTTIINAPIPNFNYQNLQIKPDNCQSGKGEIKGIVVNDLRNGVGSYVWLNSLGDSVGNAANIQNLPAGSYQLKVTDMMGCTVVSQEVTVNNENTALENPLYDDQVILKNSAATLTIKNFRPGQYELFDDPTALQPVQSNTTGVFSTAALSADKLMYVRFTSGVCSSNLVPVKITVVDKTGIYVPTAFTPNGDGKNDVLRIVAHGRVTLHNFTVFNRWGEAVFSTGDFSKGWDGTLRGQAAVAGVYVWIVKAKDELTGKMIEQKGTVTIIR